VIEARDRIGGRTWTDHESFPGIPFDRGAHWLHSASQNPFVGVADRLGFRYRREFTYKTRHLFSGGGATLAPGTVAAARADLDRSLGAAARLGGVDPMASVADALDPTDPWHRLTWRTLSQMLGRDPDQCGAADLARYRDTGEDWPVEDGYGALVAAHGRTVPMNLSTPALRLDWSGKGVAVETPRGTLRARAAVVTVSTGVLAAGAIRFRPDLPLRIMEAIHGCPLGSFEKIAIRLDRPVSALADAYGDVIDRPPLGRDPVNIVVHPFGRPLLVLHVAGRVGRALEVQGEAAMREAGVEIAAHAFGSDLRRRVRKVEVTRWGSDPWSRGSYSVCRPGQAHARKTLAEPVGDRLLFAGEHTSSDSFGTVHGAHLSGEAAAGRALGLLGA